MKKRQKNKKTSIKPMWWIIGTSVLVFVLAAIIVLPVRTNPWEQVKQTGSSTSTSRIVEYRGNGYQISYPRDWQLDESEEEAPAIVFTSPGQQAKVYIQALYDPRLVKSEEYRETIKEITESFSQNPDYTIISSQTLTIHERIAYLVEGAFKDSGKQQEFREYTIFGDDGNYYSLRINNNPGDYQKALDGMVSSFTITQPNQDEVKARDAVTKVTEVQGFKNQVENGGRSTFGVSIDRTPTSKNPYYVVQVYEIFPDHITTFNWYRVTSQTWVVERQDLATDTWEQVD